MRIEQSMPRKGNCIDDGAMEQVFGRMKDKFFRRDASFLNALLV